ncbi:MAG TPA: DNA gyrase inhibitor YacG [Rhodobiaceae bacterium]|nr:DNA gyrase inhibitor YacG [Rhodobiaceae bacterium]|tara:strand:- start:126 stop:326 length:201 start_codon:yes stop_codon:yes gene_type:complete
MAKCPICKAAETVTKFRPFCSKRCADVDLHRWMGGQYAVPVEEPSDDFDVGIETAIAEQDMPDKLH